MKFIVGDVPNVHVGKDTHKANVLSPSAAQRSAAPPLRTAQHPQQDLLLGVAMVAKVERVRL